MNAILPTATTATATSPDAARDALLSTGLTGNSRIVWRMLVEARDRGATSDEMAAAVYPSGAVPASWDMLRARHIAQLRPCAAMNGLVIVKEGSPTRWRLAAPPAPEPPPPAAPVARPARPTKRALGGYRTIVPIRFDGIAAAVDALHAKSCRWLLDEPGAGARFCAEIRDEGKPYCPEHQGQASGGRWSPQRAA